MQLRIQLSRLVLPKFDGYLVSIMGPLVPSYHNPATMVQFEFDILLQRIDIEAIALVGADILNKALGRNIEPWNVDEYAKDQLQQYR